MARRVSMAREMLSSPRYLLTLHGIVVALGLIVYVGVARALPQRRDPSAAIAWVVALALVPYVAVPLYLMFGSRKLRMRDAPLPLPPVATGRADDDEAASLWARRLGRSMGLAPAAPYQALQHARRRQRGAPRRARGDRQRDADARRLHLHPRPRPARRRDRGGAARQGRARACACAC